MVLNHIFLISCATKQEVHIKCKAFEKRQKCKTRRTGAVRKLPTDGNGCEGQLGERELPKSRVFLQFPHFHPKGSRVSAKGTAGLAAGSLGPRRGPGWAPPSKDPLGTVPLSPGPPRRRHSAPPSPTPTTSRLLTTNRFLSSTSCRFRRISDFKTSILLSGLKLSRAFFLLLQLPGPGLFTQPAAANLLTHTQPKYRRTTTDRTASGGSWGEREEGTERCSAPTVYVVAEGWRPLAALSDSVPKFPWWYERGKDEHECSKWMLHFFKMLYTYVNCTSVLKEDKGYTFLYRLLEVQKLHSGTLHLWFLKSDLYRLHENLILGSWSYLRAKINVLKWEYPEQ